MKLTVKVMMKIMKNKENEDSVAEEDVISLLSELDNNIEKMNMDDDQKKVSLANDTQNFIKEKSKKWKKMKGNGVVLLTELTEKLQINVICESCIEDQLCNS